MEATKLIEHENEKGKTKEKPKEKKEKERVSEENDKDEEMKEAKTDKTHKPPENDREKEKEKKKEKEQTTIRDTETPSERRKRMRYGKALCVFLCVHAFRWVARRRHACTRLSSALSLLEDYVQLMGGDAEFYLAVLPPGMNARVRFVYWF